VEGIYQNLIKGDVFYPVTAESKSLRREIIKKEI